MKKILTLEDNLGEEYDIIAISSHLRDYRICWFLNRTMQINLARYSDFMFTVNRKLILGAPFFHFDDLHYRTSYSLIANRQHSTPVIPGLSAYDFVLFIKNHRNLPKLKEEVILIRKITNILTAVLTAAGTMAGMDALLSDMELHIIQHQQNEKQKQKQTPIFTL